MTDTERLDWIEKHRGDWAGWMITEDNVGDGIDINQVTKLTTMDDIDETAVAATFREAIDKAAQFFP